MEYLVESLADIPQGWALTPVYEKRPYRPGWESEPPLHRGNLALQLLEGTAIEGDRGEYIQQWNGYGLRTGSISGGLLGVDCDNAQAALDALSGGDLPPTVAWQGKRGVNRVYRLPEATQAAIAAAGGWGGKKFIQPDGGEIDFRYDGKQAVLPPSAHPEVGQYRWVASPADVEVATAPTWLIALVEAAVTQGNTTETPQKRSSNVTPGEWPLLPPIQITGPGQANDALRQLANWGYNKLGHRTEEALGEYLTTNAPKLPGWSEFASRQSRFDIGKSWGYRWAKSSCKYWSSARATHRKEAPDTQWQDWLQADSISRMQWCIDRAKGLGEKFFSQNDLIRKFCEWAKEQFGRGFSKSTLLRAKEVWAYLLGGASLEATPPADTGEIPVQNVPNSTVLYHQKNQGFQPGTGLFQTPQPEVEPQAEPQAAATPTPTQFRKGDRVVFDDGTGLAYCGAVATVQARVTDEGGNTCYRLSIDYQGREGTKARKVEALPQFLKRLPETVTGDNHCQRKLLPIGDKVNVHWQLLQAVLGDANPFLGGRWDVTPADIGKAAWQRLQAHLAQGGVTHA